MARSGLSVSLGGRTIETVHSIAAPLMRAGKVEDARLKGLYALQAGQTAGQLIREEKDAGYVVESLRHNASESANMWEKARDWDRADRIENSRLGKKNSFALDIALGSSKSKSEIESTAHVIKGSMIHGENTVSVRADQDISVSGSRIEGKDVNLEAGRHILITAGENSTEEKQNTHSTSGNMGVSLGVEGIQGIRGGYSSGKGKKEETSRTYEDSRIKAENTLNFVSGKDTAVKGGKLEGDRVKGGVGGSLSLETVQDEKSYHEESHSAGITLSYDFSHGKSGVSGGLSKENIQSHYESASSQSVIYAGDEGFDISVKDNTHLKGAVIDSKGDAEKNTLRTGTLSWEDVENKADYRLSGKGIAVNKTPNAPYNEKGVTPAIPTGSSGKADSTTRAGIAPGTIMIQDKDNQRQDMAALNRNTRDSLNKLGEIFNKTKVEERQELAGLFGKLAFNYLHDAKLTPNQRAAWHAAIGGIMGQLSNKDFIAGALPAGINEMMIGEIQKAAHGDPALMQWIGACVGAVAGQLVSGHSQIGGSAAASGVKNNDSLEAEQAASHGDSASQVIEADEMNTSSQYNDFNNEEELSENRLSLKIIKIGINSGMIPDPKTMKTDYCLGKIEGGVFKLAGAEAGYILDKMGNVYKFIGTSVSAGVGAPVSVGIGTGNIYGDRNDIIGSISGVSIGFGGSGVVGVSVSRGVAEESPITVELITDASAGTNISWRYTEYVGNIYS